MKFSGIHRPLFFLLLTGCLCCNKQEEQEIIQTESPPVALSGMVLCHNRISWDSAAIRNKLIGKWQWEFISCYWNREDANSRDFKGLTVVFKQDNTLEVTANEQSKKTATWSVVKLNDGNYTLAVSPIVLQLPGRVIFCEDRVVFSDSYVDGCDNYFKRQN